MKPDPAPDITYEAAGATACTHQLLLLLKFWSKDVELNPPSATGAVVLTMPQGRAQSFRNHGHLSRYNCR